MSPETEPRVGRVQYGDDPTWRLVYFDENGDDYFLTEHDVTVETFEGVEHYVFRSPSGKVFAVPTDAVSLTDPDDPDLFGKPRLTGAPPRRLN